MTEPLISEDLRALNNQFGVEYLSRVPEQSEIPAGRVLVHNSVRPGGPNQKLGVRGFRAWLASRGDDLVTCNCDWAPDVETHYQVKAKT